MAEAITLVLTDAGLDALVNAQSGITDNIVITQIGISDQQFVPAPTLTALPHEFKRIGTISGQSVSENVIHMTAQDSDDEAYDVLGIGLFLDDGTLFATYSQATPIARKTSIGNFLFSVDVAFGDADAVNIDFGDATFLYPPASETVKGVAEIATQAEVDAGTDDTRIVTPLKLAQVVAAIVGGFTSATETAEGVIELATQAEVDAGTDDARAVTPAKLAARLAPIIAAIAAETDQRQIEDAALEAAINAEEAARSDADAALQVLIDALLARTITGGGLVTGGGNLSANRVLSVAIASAAEIAAGALNTKAVTPYGLKTMPQDWNSVLGLGGSIIKVGTVYVNYPGGGSHTFPVAFPTSCDRVLLTPLGNPDTGDEDDEPWWISSATKTGFSVATTNSGLGTTFGYLAIGH